MFQRVALNNVVDLDSASRAFACDPHALLPLLAGFDFGTAFPSLSQQWLFIVLLVSGVPDGFHSRGKGFLVMLWLSGAILLAVWYLCFSYERA